jgi:hypothetical protein
MMKKKIVTIFEMFIAVVGANKWPYEWMITLSKDVID